MATEISKVFRQVIWKGCSTPIRLLESRDVSFRSVLHRFLFLEVRHTGYRGYGGYGRYY